MSDATITLQATIDATLPSINFLPLTIGASNNPAITWANIVKQTILAPGYKYRWNRSTKTFMTSAGVQSFTLTGLTTFGFPEIASVQKVATITSASLTNNLATYIAANTFTAGDQVTTANCTTTALNVTQQPIVSATPTQFTIEITHGNISSEDETGATASLIIDAAGQPGIFPVEIRDNAVGEGTEQDRPHYLFLQTDDDTGNIVAQTMPVSDQQYQIVLTYQNAASLFTALTGAGSLWSPIPDYMEYIFQAGFLSFALDYNENAAGAARQRQIFVAGVLAHASGLTDQDVDVFIRTWLPDATEGQRASLKAQQGVQAKGI